MGLACTDTGNAARLVARFGQDIKYVPEWGAFLIWDETGWVTDTGGMRVMKLAQRTVAAIDEEARMEEPESPKRAMYLKWRMASESRARLEAMVSLVKAHVTIHHEELDVHPYLLNCANGTVNLRTGRLQKHRREDLLTKTTKVFYRKGARAPLWERFLRQVVPDRATRDFLQRMAGYAATGDVSERMFAILHGKGRNGKSLLLHMLKRAIGGYAGVAAPELLMLNKGTSHPTDVADLYGVRLAIANEVKKGRTFDEEQVKRLTGGDVLKARRMREDFWEFNPTHKIILAANHTPNVHDASDSFWDRVALIPFETRITDAQVDRGLLEKLSKELPGILAWIVRGAVLWQRAGLIRPKNIETATREYRTGEDRVGQFFASCLVLDSRGYISNVRLREVADVWAAEHKLRHTFTDKDLVDKLVTLGCERSRNGSGKSGTQSRGWRGIKLV